MRQVKRVGAIYSVTWLGDIHGVEATNSKQTLVWDLLLEFGTLLSPHKVSVEKGQ